MRLAALTMWVLMAQCSIAFAARFTSSTVTSTFYSRANWDMSGDLITWDYLTATGADVYLYDGNAIQHLTPDSQYDGGPAVSGGTVVWQRSTTQPRAHQIVVWREGLITPLTNGTISGRNTIISGENVAWYSGVNYPSDVVHYDGTELRTLAEASTIPNLLCLAGDFTAWTSGHDGAVMLDDGVTTRRIWPTTALALDVASNGHAVWVAWPEPNAATREVYYFDGNEVTQITNNEIVAPVIAISSSHAAWVTGSSPNFVVNVSDGTTI